MKKRLLAVVTAAVLALGCFASANAAKLEYSISEDSINALTVNNEALTIEDGLSWAGKSYSLRPFAVAVNGEDDLEAKKVAYSHLRAQAKVAEGKIEGLFNIVCKDADEDEPAEIIIPYDKAKAGKGYTIYRYDTKGKIWNSSDIKVTKVENGKIYCAVKKDGPVALVKGGTTTAAADANKTGAAATTGKAAPKTGEV